MLNCYGRIGFASARFLMVLLCFSLIGCAADAASEVSAEKAKHDSQNILNMLSRRPFMEIGQFEILNSESPFEGRLYVDVKAEIKVNETALENLQLSGRQLEEVRQVDGHTKRMRLTYEQIAANLWEFKDFGSVPFTPSSEEGENYTGPSEDQIKKDFIEGMGSDELSDELTENVEIEILSGEMLEADLMQVTMILKMSTPSDINGEPNGFEDEGSVTYRRKYDGQWEMEQGQL